MSYFLVSVCSLSGLQMELVLTVSLPVTALLGQFQALRLEALTHTDNLL